MKWVFCNGKTMEIRDVGPVLMRLERPDKSMVAQQVDIVERDDLARDRVRRVLASGAIDRLRTPGDGGAGRG